METHTYALIAQINAAHKASGMHVRAVLVGEPIVLGKPEGNVFEWMKKTNTCKFFVLSLM